MPRLAIPEPATLPCQPAAWSDAGQDDALLERFVWRMGSLGMSVSRALMITDPGYAVCQMAHARQMADAELDALSLALFMRFQTQRSGLLAVH